MSRYDSITSYGLPGVGSHADERSRAAMGWRPGAEQDGRGKSGERDEGDETVTSVQQSREAFLGAQAKTASYT